MMLVEILLMFVLAGKAQTRKWKGHFESVTEAEAWTRDLCKDYGLEVNEIYARALDPEDDRLDAPDCSELFRNYDFRQPDLRPVENHKGVAAELFYYKNRLKQIAKLGREIKKEKPWMTRKLAMLRKEYRKIKEAVDFYEKHPDVFEDPKERRPVLQSVNGHMRNGKWIDSYFRVTGFEEPVEPITYEAAWTEHDGTDYTPYKPFPLYKKRTNDTESVAKAAPIIDALKEGKFTNGRNLYRAIAVNKLCYSERSACWTIWKKNKQQK